MSEAFKEVDTSSNGVERSPVAQRLPKSDSYQPKPSASYMGPTSDYQPHSEQSTGQRQEMASPTKDPAVNASPHSLSSHISGSASPAAMSTSQAKSTPPRVSAVSAVSVSPISAPGPPVVSSPAVESTPPHISTPPNLSSSPCPTVPPRLSSPSPMVQGLRPPPAAVAQTSPVGSTHLSVGSSSSPMHLPASPSNLSAPPPSVDSIYKPAVVSSVPPVPAPSSVSAPFSLQQMVQGSRPPPLTSRFPETSGTRHEKSGPPSLVSDTSSVSATSVITNSSSVTVAHAQISVSNPSTSVPHCLSTSAPSSVSKTPSVRSPPCDSVPTPQCQILCHPPGVDSGPSTAFAALSAPGELNLSSLTAHDSLRVRPLSTLPLLTTQASRTAPVSAPPALVSVLPAMGGGGVVKDSDSEPHPPKPTPPQALKQLPPKPEYHSDGGNRKEFANMAFRKSEECPLQHDVGTVQTSQNVEATESHKSETHSHQSLTGSPGSLPFLEEPLLTRDSANQKANCKMTGPQKHQLQSNVGYTCEAENTVDQSPLRDSPQRLCTRVQDSTEEETFDDLSYSASEFEGKSTCDTYNSSVLENTSYFDDNSSCVDDSTHFDNSFRQREDNTSQFDDTSLMEGEPSSVCDTTRDSSSFIEDSRVDTLDSTKAGETSEVEETQDSCQSTGVSILDSSLNSASQMEVDTNDGSISHSFVSPQLFNQGTFLKSVVIETNITLLENQSSLIEINTEHIM